MNSVLTLIVKSGEALLLENMTLRATELLKSLGISHSEPVALAQNEAIDIPTVTAKPEALAEHLAAAFTGLPLDYYIQPETGRRKQLLLADMDSTLIINECIDELADYAGVGQQVAEITKRAMQGELNFETSLTERVALLNGLNENVLETCFQERIQLNSGARELISTLKSHKVRTVLVSGGFTFFTAKIAGQLGIDRHIANQLEIINGKLTGRVIPPISGPTTKFDTLVAECAALGIQASDVAAIGDGANDIPMLETAGLGIAIHAKPNTASAADIAIKHSDLRSALFLQGYKL